MRWPPSLGPRTHPGLLQQGLRLRLLRRHRGAFVAAAAPEAELGQGHGVGGSPRGRDPPQKSKIGGDTHTQPRHPSAHSPAASWRCRGARGSRRSRGGRRGRGGPGGAWHNGGVSGTKRGGQRPHGGIWDPPPALTLSPGSPGAPGGPCVPGGPDMPWGGHMGVMVAPWGGRRGDTPPKHHPRWGGLTAGPSGPGGPSTNIPCGKRGVTGVSPPGGTRVTNWGGHTGHKLGGSHVPVQRRRVRPSRPCSPGRRAQPGGGRHVTPPEGPVSAGTRGPPRDPPNPPRGG